MLGWILTEFAVCGLLKWCLTKHWSLSVVPHCFAKELQSGRRHWRQTRLSTQDPMTSGTFSLSELICVANVKGINDKREEQVGYAKTGKTYDIELYGQVPVALQHSRAFLVHRSPTPLASNGLFQKTLVVGTGNVIGIGVCLLDNDCH